MPLQQPPHPIFLISQARTGTNLFMHLFSEHPQIVQKDYSFFNAYLYGPENQRGKIVEESANPAGIPVDGSLFDETFQKAYDRLEKIIASIILDETSPKTLLFKEHSPMLLKTRVFQSQKPDWASPSPKIAKAIESVTSSNSGLSAPLPSLERVTENPTYLPDGVLGLFSPVILIRHPAVTVPSFHRAMLKVGERPDLDTMSQWDRYGSQTSPHAQWLLWEWYNDQANQAEALASKEGNAEANGSIGTNGTVKSNVSYLRPIVIDMDLDLLSHPDKTIDLLTTRLSLAPTGILQSWTPAASASDHPGMTAFKGTLLESGGLMPAKTVSDDIRGVEAKKWEAEWGKEESEVVLKWVEELLGVYEKLRGKRTRLALPRCSLDMD